MGVRDSKSQHASLLCEPVWGIPLFKVQDGTQPALSNDQPRALPGRRGLPVPGMQGLLPTERGLFSSNTCVIVSVSEYLKRIVSHESKS